MRPARRSRTALVLAAGLILGAFLAGAAGGAAPTTRVAPVSWSKVSGPTRAGAQLGLARTADGTLNVIWNRGTSPTSIFDTRLSSAGKVTGTTTIATGWDGNEGLDLLVMPDKTLRLFATGGHVPGLGSGDSGVNTLTAPSTGRSWTLAKGVVWGGAVASAASEISATLTRDGQVVTGWSGYTHVGLDSSGDSPLQYPDMLVTQLATDQRSGSVVLSGVTIAHKGGTFVRQILPRPGRTVIFPSATQNRSSGIAARIGASGVYVAYADTKSVRLARYGGPTKTLAQGPYDTADVFTGPQGRLWIAWGDENDGLFVTRSNRAADAFEPVQTVKLPANTNGMYSIEGEGSAGALDLFADLLVGTTDRGFQRAHILALFGLQASVGRRPQKATVAPVALSLRDAGDPVSGAKITVAGKHLQTDAKGRVTLSLKPGSYSATASAAGYAPASVSFTVK